MAKSNRALVGRAAERFVRHVETKEGEVAPNNLESVQNNDIAARVGQVEYLGVELGKREIPIVRPVGGFTDATSFTCQIARDDCPAQTLRARGLGLADASDRLRFFRTRFERV